mmetsp:Transcript_16321/g.21320  ORF Transcript_16321/g.21320 Transcript_16321/m.21320 type:complete len:239 (-) Transcript_16321:51-767(-)
MLSRTFLLVGALAYVVKVVLFGKKVYTREELARYKDVPYVAIMGQVFDCTQGKKYYISGGYDFFAGTDGSLAFVTGDFENNVTDNVSSLDQIQLAELQRWTNETYHKKYTYKGVLHGYFYTANGRPTHEHLQILRLIQKEQSDKVKREEDAKKYPNCKAKSFRKKNITTRSVSCSLPGYVPRSRSVFGGQPRCACLPLSLEGVSFHDKESIPYFPDCPLDNSSCFLILNSSSSSLGGR